jgi:hypothetical protein
MFYPHVLLHILLGVIWAWVKLQRCLKLQSCGVWHAFLIRNHFVQRHLGWSWRSWVATNNFLQVMKSHIFYLELVGVQMRLQSHLKLWLCRVWTCLPNIRNSYVQDDFVQPPQLLGQSQKFWVAVNNFLWVRMTHNNPLHSLSFFRIMYKYKALPQPNHVWRSFKLQQFSIILLLLNTLGPHGVISRILIP